MSSGFLANIYPDYEEGKLSEYLDEQRHIKPEVMAKSQKLLNNMQAKLNAAISTLSFDVNSDYTIYSGYCGMAYVYLYDFMKSNSENSFKVARDLTERAIPNLKGEVVSFLNGDAGPLALAIILYNKEGREEEKLNLINKLIALPEQVGQFSEDFLDGRAGYIFSLLFVNKHLRKAISDEVIRKQLDIMIDAGVSRATADKFDCPLKYVWKDNVYVGAAHGMAGILYVMLLCRKLLSKDEMQTVIKPTLDWLIHQRYPRTNNFLASANSKVDKLVQWCHGAPGVVPLLILASEIFPSGPYFSLALECGEVVWNTGILAKGYSICHGVSGNAYTFIQLFKATKNIQHLHRLACFIHWNNKYPKEQGMKPDNPLSLFEGVSGLTYFLMDIKDIYNSSFPAFELNRD